MVPILFFLHGFYFLINIDDFFSVFSIKLSMKYVNRFCMSLTVLKK
jgi:hypothetical protein